MYKLEFLPIVYKDLNSITKYIYLKSKSSVYGKKIINLIMKEIDIFLIFPNKKMILNDIIY